MTARLFNNNNNMKFAHYHTQNPLHFDCLQGQDVIAARISDHHPIIHNDVVFWNVMMQGKCRITGSAKSYNNGFGIVESDDKYIKRINKVSNVIAEILEKNTHINVVTICEGPILNEHIIHAMEYLQIFNFEYHTTTNNKWGLYMLVNRRYQIQSETENIVNTPDKLAERFMVLKLTSNKAYKYIALAHFPYGGDVYATNSENLSIDSKIYVKFIKTLLNRYSDESFTFCADFNFNPYLICDYKERELDKITHYNSILHEHKQQRVTVDGILLSKREKQIHHNLYKANGLFSRLLWEQHLANTTTMLAIKSDTKDWGKIHP